MSSPTSQTGSLFGALSIQPRRPCMAIPQAEPELLPLTFQTEKNSLYISDIFQISWFLSQMLIYRVRQQPPAKYVEVFRISGAPVSVWGYYCNLEWGLRHMFWSVERRHPQHGHSSHGFSQSGQTDLSISGFRSLFSNTVSSARFRFEFYLSLFFRITHVADERREQWERGWRMSGFVCSSI